MTKPSLADVATCVRLNFAKIVDMAIRGSSRIEIAELLSWSHDWDQIRPLLQGAFEKAWNELAWKGGKVRIGTGYDPGVFQILDEDGLNPDHRLAVKTLREHGEVWLVVSDTFGFDMFPGRPKGLSPFYPQIKPWNGKKGKRRTTPHANSLTIGRSSRKAGDA